MIDDIVSWAKFISVVLDGYRSIVHPLLSPVVDFLGLGSWAKDYLFVGIMVSSARVRALYNNMRDSWRIDVSRSKWWHIWAPHKIAAFIVSFLAALFWPLTALAFLPARILSQTLTTFFSSRSEQIRINGFWFMRWSLHLCLQPTPDSQTFWRT